MNSYPKMLIIRNTVGGMICQAYKVETEKEVELLSKSARSNGFIVQEEHTDFCEETTPNWRNTKEWFEYSNGIESERAKGQRLVREILKNIRRDGPYWLGGYNDWLVSCYSLRNPEDLKGYTPIACWSELSNNMCKQWLVLLKDNDVFIDYLPGNAGGRGYGIKPIKVDTITYPSHIFDWIFKDVLARLNLDKQNSKV